MGGTGPGAPRHPPAGTGAKALRLQEMTELGSGQQRLRVGGRLAPPGRRAQPVLATGIGGASGEMNRPTRGLSSPRLPHKGLGCTTGHGGPGATGRRGEAILKDTPTPGHCTPRKGPWAGVPVPWVQAQLGLGSAEREEQTSQDPGLSFPHGIIPGILPPPDVPLLVSPLSAARSGLPHPPLPVPSQGP